MYPWEQFSNCFRFKGNLFKGQIVKQKQILFFQSLNLIVSFRCFARKLVMMLHCFLHFVALVTHPFINLRMWCFQWLFLTTSPKQTCWLEIPHLKYCFYIYKNQFTFNQYYSSKEKYYYKNKKCQNTSYVQYLCSKMGWEKPKEGNLSSVSVHTLAIFLFFQLESRTLMTVFDMDHPWWEKTFLKPVLFVSKRANRFYLEKS